MRERVCKNCGGRKYIVVGQNMVKCQFCGTLYVDDLASKEEEYLTVAAYEKLRERKFEEAAVDFDKVLTLYPLSFEAYFGHLQSKHKLVLYTNKRGTKKPRFFGDSIESVENDIDYENALNNAPEEVAVSYRDVCKKIEKIYNAYQAVGENNNCDVFVYETDFEKENQNDVSKNILKSLEEKGLKTFFYPPIDGKEKEEETFYALNKAKVFVVLINGNKDWRNPEFIHLFDRWLYFIAQKRKSKTSLVLVVNGQVVSEKDLPDYLGGYKNFVDYNDPDVCDKLCQIVKKEAENAIEETAKIETVKISKVSPKKKEYVEVETINPSELGHYHVENVELDSSNKIKWVFLCLKNGDFESANITIKKELEKDPNNSELLFAEMLCNLKLKTAGQFFETISNFQDKEKIEKILKYASKDFAEMFVDNWEKLVASLDSEDYFNEYLLYLAQFNSPYRERFVDIAQDKAVETLNPELIENVQKCFRQDEVDKFTNFYFELAQKTGIDEYYQKVLDIDAGHVQSNLAVVLKKFKTSEDTLTYRDREELEDIFKYLDETSRTQIVSTVVSIILPNVYIDIEEAEKQLDFYLGYVSEDLKLKAILITIATKLQSMGFFRLAERYLSIAISKGKPDANLYWRLICIKAHIETDTEILTSSIKVSQMPEWETLLSLATEEETEKYANLVSKANLYEGEKREFKPDLLDKKHLLEALDDFINRNNKILLEIENEHGVKAINGINYYKLQLTPFGNYKEQLNSIKDFDDFKEVSKKIEQRLDLLKLSLESSVNVVQVVDKDNGLKGVRESKHLASAKALKKQANQHESHQKFNKRFLFTFLGLVPVMFTMLLMIISNFMPTDVYAFFTQSFVMYSVIYSALVGLASMSVYVFKKRQLGIKWKVANIILMILAFTNVVFMLVCFYIFPIKIQVSSAEDFDLFVHNANYSTIELQDNIDMANIEWKPINFYGKIVGNNFMLENLNFADKKNVALFDYNGGEVENLNIYLADKTYENIEKFGVVSITNGGKISNCNIYMTNVVTVKLKDDGKIGCVSAVQTQGAILNCNINLRLSVETNGFNLDIGYVVGEVSRDNEISIAHNTTSGALIVTGKNSSTVAIGGLVGNILEYEKVSILINHANVNITTKGAFEKLNVGGLIGFGKTGSANNYTAGTIKNEAIVNNMASGGVGGLYGHFESSNDNQVVETSYSTITFASTESELVWGGVFGEFRGYAKHCFTSNDDLIGRVIGVPKKLEDCKAKVSSYAGEGFKFDKTIWDLSGKYPVFR